MVALLVIGLRQCIPFSKLHAPTSWHSICVCITSRQEPTLVVHRGWSVSVALTSWCMMLTHGNDIPGSIENQKQMKNGQCHADMHQLLRSCLDEVGLELVTGVDHVLWHEQELPMGVLPSGKVCQEILWELYELNFRFELLALHC
jgi:hypothetical protein